MLIDLEEDGLLLGSQAPVPIHHHLESLPKREVQSSSSSSRNTSISCIFDVSMSSFSHQKQQQQQPPPPLAFPSLEINGSQEGHDGALERQKTEQDIFILPTSSTSSTSSTPSLIPTCTTSSSSSSSIQQAPITSEGGLGGLGYQSSLQAFGNRLRSIAIERQALMRMLQKLQDEENALVSEFISQGQCS
jgi:hypothetical protein